jgi:hypothetical protein
MAFPSNPSNLQTHTEYGRTYRYFSATGTWLATRGDWDYVESELDLSLITGNSPVTLGNGATYTPIIVPYVVTNRVWQATEYDPPEIPVPTVAITGTTGNLIESSTRSFVVYLTDDHDNIASLNIVSGGGSLSSNSISNGNSVIYTPTNVTSNTSVTLRATVADIRGATVTSDITFTVADTPAATVGISGNTNFMEANSSRAFTVSQSGDLDGNIQVSIIGGQGTLSHSSRTNGQSVTYTNPSYYQGTVTIRARGINYDGEITDATVAFSTAATNPTVSITGSTSQLAYGGSRSFTANHTFDSNNSIAISVVSGGGSLNKSSVSNGGSFNYSGGSHSGAVTIRATAVNYAGETATANKSFSVAQNVVTATGGSSINGQTALKQIRTSSYIGAGGTFQIPSNYWIWSDNTGVAALIIDTPNATVINNGKIIGRGGNGGNRDSFTGLAGGPAISVTAGGVTIRNMSGAYIAGGGGGGGAAGGAGNPGNTAAGGGGGAGGGSGGYGWRYSNNLGGAGGALNASGADAAGVNSWNGFGGGAGGSGGYAGVSSSDNTYGNYGGGGGGRILPGVGGENNAAGTGNVDGRGGSAGGAGDSGSTGGNGGHAGGGGGWGASGGSGDRPGGAGGAAVSGSHTKGTWSGTVYGSS